MNCSGRFSNTVTKAFHGRAAINFPYSNLTKRNQLVRCALLSVSNAPVVISCAHKSNVLVPPTLKKKINDTMLRMLQKKIDLGKKRNNFSPIGYNQTVRVPSHHLLNRKIKDLNKHVLSREAMICSVLLRELQETIDSGQVDAELENIRVELKRVVLVAKEVAVVTWETQGPNEDAHIQEVLTKHSSAIRHVIITSHVIGKVPKFAFVIDPRISDMKSVRDIIASGELDLGPMEDDEDDLLLEVTDEELKLKEKTQQTSSDPTFSLFRVDRSNLQQKIYERKFKNNNLEENPDVS